MSSPTRSVAARPLRTQRLGREGEDVRSRTVSRSSRCSSCKSRRRRIRGRRLKCEHLAKLLLARPVPTRASAPPADITIATEVPSQKPRLAAETRRVHQTAHGGSPQSASFSVLLGRLKQCDG